MIFALKIWRHYLYKVPCKIFTYHQSLKYTFTQKEGNSIQRHWLDWLNEYDLQIQYHLGNGNAVQDELCRKTQDSLDTMGITQMSMLKELKSMRVQLVSHGQASV